MKPTVFVVQSIPDVALDILREVAEGTVYPYLDRMITVDELVANARRCDYVFAMHGTMVPAEVINANPDLKGLGVLGGKTAKVDFDAAFERKLPVVSGNPAEIVGGGVSLATCDLTIGMIIALAYRLADSDRYTRQGHFKQEQTMALMGVGCPGKTVGLIGLGRV